MIAKNNTIKGQIRHSIVHTGFERFIDTYNLDIDPEVLLEACTHPSYRLVASDAITYEQLETLGDAVLDVLVTEWLITRYPSIQPGALTKQRSIIVNNNSLAHLGRDIGIAEMIRIAPSYTLGKKDIANVVEAIFGSLYLHYGMTQAKHLFEQIKQSLLALTDNYSSTNTIYNPISRLQEYCQKKGYPLPEYLLVDKQGTDHNPTFIYQLRVTIEGEWLEEIGRGGSKKQARAIAANNLLRKLT